MSGAVAASSATAAPSVQSWADKLLNGCWACDTANQLSTLGLGLAKQVFTALCGELVSLLTVTMGLWILLFAGKMFLPFGPDGHAGEMWNKGAKKLFLFALVLAFLQSANAFWDNIFIPLMSSGMGIASQIIQIGDPFEGQQGTSELLPSDNGYCQAPSLASGVEAAAQVMRQMNCPLAKLQSQFGKGMLIGEMILLGSIDKSILFPNIINDINQTVSGLSLLVIYFFGFAIYPLLLIDVIMRSTIVAVISPLAIAAYLFEPTRHFATKAVWQLVQSVLTLIFASVAGGLAKAVLAYTFSHIPTADGQPLKDWPTLVKAVEHPALSGVAIDLTSSSFYVLVGVGVILLYMVRRASHMAAEFTNTAAGDFSGVGTATATIAGAVAYVGGSAAQRLARLASGLKPRG